MESQNGFHNLWTRGQVEDTLRQSAADGSSAPRQGMTAPPHGDHDDVMEILRSRLLMDALMRERESRFADLLEVLPAAIYITDAAGRITFYNRAAAELWGRRPELGESAWCGSWKLFRPDGTPLPHDQSPMALALSENRRIRASEAVAERPDGTRVTVVAFPTPLHDSAGELVGAVNMLVDVTHQTRPSQGGDAHALGARTEEVERKRSREALRRTHDLLAAEGRDRQRELEAELCRAVQAGELMLLYQPLISLGDRRVVGAEALLRWQHPQRGLLPPAAFLPVLERSAVAGAVGRWTIAEACRILARWRDSGLPGLRVAVNLLAVQLQGGGIVDAVEESLQRNGLLPETLELELPETVALGNEPRLLEPLQRLRARGVGIAFDDFGTGFASLCAVKDSPLTRLKIDRSFIRDIPADRDSVAVVRAILTLARGMGLGVVAEGVETAEQEQFLRAEGCDEAQGYRLGRPMEAAAFAERLLGGAAVSTRRRDDLA